MLNPYPQNQMIKPRLVYQHSNKKKQLEQELENLKETESDKLKKQNHHLTKLKNQQLEELKSKF